MPPAQEGSVRLLLARGLGKTERDMHPAFACRAEPPTEMPQLLS